MYTDWSPVQSSPGVASKLLMDFNLNQFRKVDGQAAHVTCCGHLCDYRGKNLKYSALPFSCVNVLNIQVERGVLNRFCILRAFRLSY